MSLPYFLQANNQEILFNLTTVLGKTTSDYTTIISPNKDYHIFTYSYDSDYIYIDVYLNKNENPTTTPTITWRVPPNTAVAKWPSNYGTLQFATQSTNEFWRQAIIRNTAGFDNTKYHSSFMIDRNVYDCTPFIDNFDQFMLHAKQIPDVDYLVKNIPNSP